jgi:PKD repeat protein
VSLYVLDDTGNNVTTTAITLTIVVPNQPPIVTPLSPVSSVTGTTLTYTGDAYDPDNAVLRYTWDFGDGSVKKVGMSVTYAYAKPGTWTVTLYVDDLTGLAGHNVTATTTATIGWRLSLSIGWNLITLPMTTSLTANTLGLATGDEVVNWNPGTQGYDKIFIKGVSPPFMDFALAANTGYWVYVTAAKTLTLYGTVPTGQQTRTVTVPGSGGWVMIGFCSMNTGWKAESLAAMYTGSTISTVVMWNAATGLYTTHIMGLPLNNFSLVPGAGYWIFVNGSGTWTYNP